LALAAPGSESGRAGEVGPAPSALRRALSHTDLASPFSAPSSPAPARTLAVASTNIHESFDQAHLAESEQPGLPHLYPLSKTPEFVKPF